MEMEIIILGSCTGVPSLKRGAPGLIIKINRQLLLFDSGSGTLNRLLRVGIDYRKLDYIFYTHFRPVCDKFNVLSECRKEFKGKTTLGRNFLCIKA